MQSLNSVPPNVYCTFSALVLVVTITTSSKNFQKQIYLRLPLRDNFTYVYYNKISKNINKYSTKIRKCVAQHLNFKYIKKKSYVLSFQTVL